MTDILLRYLELAVALVSALAAIIAVFKIGKLHVIVNSRLTQLLKTTGGEQRAIGEAEGIEKERQRPQVNSGLGSNSE